LSSLEVAIAEYLNVKILEIKSIEKARQLLAPTSTERYRAARSGCYLHPRGAPFVQPAPQGEHAVSRPFGIVPAAAELKLHAGKAEASFTISNSLGRPARIRARVVPRGGAHESWFTLHRAEKELTADGTVQVVVQLSVPPTAPAGSFGFCLLVVNVDNPDEEYVEGPELSFAVAAAPPKKPFPWWIPAVAAAALVIVVGGILVLRPDPATVETPPVGSLTLYSPELLVKAQQLGAQLEKVRCGPEGVEQAEALAKGVEQLKSELAVASEKLEKALAENPPPEVQARAREDLATLEKGVHATERQLVRARDLSKQEHIATYNRGRGEPCGVASYKVAPNAACGVTYNTRTDAEVCGSRTETQKLTSTSCNGAQAPVCPSGWRESAVSTLQKGACNLGGDHGLHGDTGRLLTITQTCERPVAKSCANPAFGVASMLSCANPVNGVAEYQECAHPSFGVASYQPCYRADG
jgi:hypothetical protein